MEEKEILITDKIIDIREGIEKSEVKNKKQLQKDLDYIEDMVSALMNFVYGVTDCVIELKEDVEEEE